MIIRPFVLGQTLVENVNNNNPVHVVGGDGGGGGKMMAAKEKGADFAAGISFVSSSHSAFPPIVIVP